ncbi:unnamed protein product, partial [Durusdinium trenchii]
LRSVPGLLDLARWKDLQEDTLFPGTKKQNRRSSEEREDWMEEMIISKSFASIHSPRLEEAQRDPATSRTRPEPFRRSPVSGSKSGTRPRFYAELVPFSDSEDHGAPDESALSAHAWSDPWDWFFLEETPPAPALSRGREAPRIRRLEGALGSPWLAQSSPSSSRSMSPSPESTSVPEDAGLFRNNYWPKTHRSCLGLLYVERRGSVFYRLDSILGGLLVATLGGLVQYSRDHGWEYAPDIHHHYGFQALAAGVTFAVVFRTQLAWNRYWEAVTQLHFMYSKYADAFQQFYAFAEVTKKIARKAGDEDKVELVEERRLKAVEKLDHEKQRRLRGNFALLSPSDRRAFSADRLSNGDNQRMEEVHSHRIRSRAAMRVDKEWKGRWAWTRGFSLPDMVERSEYQRSQTHDKVYVVFDRPTREQLEVLSRTFAAWRFAPPNRSGLRAGAVKNCEPQVRAGKSVQTRGQQQQDTVSTVMYWIIWDLVDITKELDVAPPIQSRMYQELSNGMLGFYNCLKIADVPFPLPYAQLLGLLLIAFSCLIPFYVIIFTANPVIGPILCFFLFESLWCLNEVAKELENPFGQDLNDISVADFHVRFVDVLEDVGLPEHNSVLTGPHAPGRGPRVRRVRRGTL